MEEIKEFDDCFAIARKMLGVNNLILPEKLFDRLYEVDRICNEVGGELKNPQVIAVIIE